MKLQELGEFGFIDRVTPGCVVQPERVVKGIGDDCAVVAGGPGKLRLLTTDLLVERVHFMRHAISARQLGAKAMAVNLSDIAAMGGRALDAFVSIAIPRDVEVAYLDRLYEGLKAMAARFGVNVLGGDTTGSRADLVINVAVTGEVDAERVLYRHGARPGDRLFVTGTLGDSAGGLDAILSGRDESDEDTRLLVRHHLEPEPALAAGQAIAGTGLAHAMIDVSDGLAADLGHICDASGMGCEVRAGDLPLSAALVRYCKALRTDPLALALSGGEDYVLLVAASQDLPRALAPSGIEVVEIGRITRPEAGRVVNGSEGDTAPLAPEGWDHFRKGGPAGSGGGGPGTGR